MMLRCPVCRAENEADVIACRRCKADLTPVVALEAARARALSRAADAAVARDGAGVLLHARQAERLRSGPDVQRWQAVGHLLRREFPLALARYIQYRGETGSEPAAPALE